MPMDKRYFPILNNGREVVPFESAEEAWFWFIDAQQARNDGARITAGQGLYPRPCEPLDILKIAERLYRNRCLLMDHFLVLRHYGRRGYVPNSNRVKEMRAATLWGEAMDKLEPVLISKEIVRKRDLFPHAAWVDQAILYEQYHQGGHA